ncbi:MAG: hypothetical protein MUO50_19055 [Longimicrobiales bacterium]|nr:hypothetical protein [Longimicrobiales bacterium]
MNLTPQFGEERVCNIPDQFDIHTQIVMDHFVAGARYLLPGNLWILRP